MSKGKYCLQCAYNDEGSCSCFEPESICCPYADGSGAEFKQYHVVTLSSDCDHCDCIKRHHIITVAAESDIKIKVGARLWEVFREYLINILSVEEYKV